MAQAPFNSPDMAIDLVQELRLRRWARENYVAVEFRDPSWHAHVLDEMCRRDDELELVDVYGGVAQRIVPLVSELLPALRGPHHDRVHMPVLARIPFVE